MRNPQFDQMLAGWASLHGLQAIPRRYPCGHGLTGRSLTTEDHRRYCLGDDARLIARGSLWRDSTGTVLATFPYGPRSDDLEHVGFWSAVEAYARRFQAVPFTPSASNLLHGLFDEPDSTVVLYGAGVRWRALRSMCTGVERSWVPPRSSLFGEQRARADRQP